MLGEARVHGIDPFDGVLDASGDGCAGALVAAALAASTAAETGRPSQLVGDEIELGLQRP